ncbi:putative bifunctional diguanylate cyclase/phosphodiesterase [Paenibacillus paeoniae]|uniref:EAL domain-containing protein n=1 Tax=Paenibacillus paeoniae TaxID=2292705 RepID=A0A371PGB8_9BACL|nr:EAL domain-containing protein [Paenibacillus paeoniae]REK74982.1 EAL domain-containing protein [Paenibacillus paeoniae]
MLRHIDSSRTRRSTLFIACIVIMALISASEQLQLIYGITFTFTNIMLLLLIRLFGLRIGLTAGVVTYSAAVLLFNSPLYMVIFLLEACWIGIWQRRKQVPVLVPGIAFWIIMGTPLTLLGCYLSGPFSTTEFILLLAVTAANGMFNALISEILVDYLPLRRWLNLDVDKHKPIPFSRALFHLSITIVALPFLVIMIISGWNSYHSSTNSTLQTVSNTASSISDELIQWSDEDILGVRLHNVIQIGYLNEIINRHTSQKLFDITMKGESENLMATTSLKREADRQKVVALQPIAENFGIEMPQQQSIMLMPTEQWRDANYVYRLQMENMPILIAVSVPVETFKEQIFLEYIYHLLYTLGSVLVAGILAYGINRWLSRGLRQLAGSTTNLPIKLTTGVPLEWPNSGILEIDSLVHNFKDMSLNLSLMLQDAERMNQQLRNSEEQLHVMAYFDNLTGLPNRHHFQQTLEAMLADSGHSDQKFAVMFVDLNRFKQINDSLGHATGDVLLQAVAMRFTDIAEENCHVFRLGGDEFVFVLHYLNSASPVEFAERICACFNLPFELNESVIYTTTSVGISLYPENGSTIDDIVKKADMAMYKAKEQGRSSYHFFDHEMEQSMNDKMHLENGMRRALENKQFFLMYQPKVCPGTGATIGFEALVRWEHHELGLIPPYRFIPLAEASGLILDIDMWVFREACRQAKKWQERGFPLLPVSINLSAKHFDQRNLVEGIVEILKDTRIDPHMVVIEITESVFIRQMESVIDMLTELQQLGIQISIDDFGTGYSSLSQLQRLPVSIVKLDRTFIKDAEHDVRKSSVVRAVIELAHSMGLRVVAEGIETEEERVFFAGLHCDELQGYYFSKPLRSEQFERYIRNEMRSLPFQRRGAEA